MSNAINNDSMKSLLLGFVDIINEQRAELPAGCVSKAGNGVFNAHSISDVSNLSYNVDAPDGFIRDGFMVKMANQRKSTKEDKFNGYRVVFELNGLYNGVYTIFTKTEMEYKLYLNRNMWDIQSCEVNYRPITDAEPMNRIYKVPMSMDLNSNEFRCVDRRNSLANKVAMAMKSKLSADYDAYYNDMIFDEEECRFIEKEDSSI